MFLPCLVGVMVWEWVYYGKKHMVKEQLKLTVKCEIISKFPILLFIVASAWNYRVEFKIIIVLFLFSSHVIAYQAVTNSLLYSVFISFISFFFGILVEVYL